MKLTQLLILVFFLTLLSSCRTGFDKKVKNIIESANKVEVYFCEEQGSANYRHLNNIKMITINGKPIIDLKEAIYEEVGRGDMAASFGASLILIFYDNNNKVELAIDFPRGRLCVYSDIYPPITDPNLLRPGETQREFFQFHSLDYKREQTFMNILNIALTEKSK